MLHTLLISCRSLLFFFACTLNSNGDAPKDDNHIREEPKKVLTLNEDSKVMLPAIKVSNEKPPLVVLMLFFLLITSFISLIIHFIFEPSVRALRIRAAWALQSNTSWVDLFVSGTRLAVWLIVPIFFLQSFGEKYSSNSMNVTPNRQLNQNPSEAARQSIDEAFLPSPVRHVSLAQRDLVVKVSTGIDRECALAFIFVACSSQLQSEWWFVVKKSSLMTFTNVLFKRLNLDR